MRTLVAIATRGRPLRLAGALHSFRTLQSGNHQVDYVVRVDDDDTQTLELVPQLADTYGIEVVILPRPVTLGQAWNEIAADREWDACAVVADKHLCLSPHWDEGISILFEKQQLPMARWNLLRAPEEMAMIMPRKWYDTVGRIYPEWFPFWFSETWVREVHQLAFGKDVTSVNDMPITEPALKTQNLRNLELWFDFFAKTRALRIREADQIAATYGVKPFNRQPLLDSMRKIDEWQKPRIPGYYATRSVGADAAPSAQYLIAEQRAIDWLRDNVLEYTETAGAA